MKYLQQNSKRWAGIFGMMCLLAGLFSSCVKDRHDGLYIVDPPVSTPAALISVINASPDSQPLDFLLDKNQANNYPLKYGQVLDYLGAYTGLRTASFYVSGSSVKITSDTIRLVANKYYSLFLSNSVTKPDVTLLTDTLNKPATGMAAVRFIDLSTDAPKVDLGIKGGAVLAANRSYKGFSSFLPVAGNTALSLEVRLAGTSTVLVSLSNITLRTGSVYTVWLHGLAAATDQTRLTIDIQQNAYFY